MTDRARKMVAKSRPVDAALEPKSTPKPASGNVRNIKSGGHAGGRRSSKGYDPSTGEETGYVPTTDSTTEHDVFALVSSKGYSEERFYCRSTNLNNHGEKLNLRVPLGIDSQMYAAVAQVPDYTTLQDLVRDAVLHRLEYLQKRYSLGEGARRTLELERMRADSERRAQEATVMSESVDDLAEKLQMLWDKEDWGLMAEELEEGGERVDWLRDPYKARATKVLDDWKGRARVKIAEARARNEID